MGLFDRKKLIKVELIEQLDGFSQFLSEDDKLTNLALGHMTGGFDGMVAADVFNSCATKTTPPKRRYRLTYSDGSRSTVLLAVGTRLEKDYYNLVHKRG